MIDQDVNARAAAYRGNPQALQQKYAASQQLIDLLALQKIKSMQEAAAREMQMQMAQQQAANGESNMTVAQQREKEVMDMTKNELAQQRGELAQQQGVEQKEAMQKLMSGIANAPGAASAMEPQAMAAGGIVAFKTGDDVKDERYKRKEGESFEDFRTRVLAMEQADTQERLKRERSETERGRLMELEKRGGAAIPPSPYGIKRDLGIASLASTAPQAPAPAMDAETQKLARLSANPPAAQNMNPALQPSANVAPMAPPPPQAAKPPMPAAPPAAPTKPQDQGLGGLQMGPPEDTLQNALRRQSIAGMNIDPKAEKLAEEKRIEDRLKLTPDQRAVYDEGIAGLKKFYDRDFDPELQRREGIKRFLIGMGGRSQGEFAGGAETAMNYDTAQKQQQRARFNEMQKSREGLIGLDRGAVTGGIEGGFKTYEQTGQTQRNALTAGANMYGTDTQSKDNAAKLEAQTKDNAAMRDIERLRIASSNAANAATRESTDLYRMQQESTKILRYRADAMDKATKPFARQLDMVNMALSSNPKDANALKEKQAIELRMDIARDAASKPFDLDLARVESYMYGKKGPIAGAKVEKLSK